MTDKNKNYKNEFSQKYQRTTELTSYTYVIYI